MAFPAPAMSAETKKRKLQEPELEGSAKRAKLDSKAAVHVAAEEDKLAQATVTTTPAATDAELADALARNRYERSDYWNTR